jgi:hypothetical protein
MTSSLSDLGCRSEKSAGRGKISPDLQRQYQDIGQKAGEICTVQVILQSTTPKSDRLLACQEYRYGVFMGTSNNPNFVAMRCCEYFYPFPICYTGAFKL